jgi:hypothetical protein
MGKFVVFGKLFLGHCVIHGRNRYCGFLEFILLALSSLVSPWVAMNSSDASRMGCEGIVLFEQPKLD